MEAPDKEVTIKDIASLYGISTRTAQRRLAYVRNIMNIGNRRPTISEYKAAFRLK